MRVLMIADEYFTAAVRPAMGADPVWLGLDLAANPEQRPIARAKREKRAPKLWRRLSGNHARGRCGAF
ncbi:hypothetical protein [Sphingomonas hengshuiensis]|uniref:Uncharacterized protein n=1 Tax=Sphingomonas hengshuiensis TaxID=1609977 RepID=A0A7U4JA31_9SPHN|nr:hypothetical protein [Sphingomonas hengshuiensis]AJP72937.1 hypothetical protein TS85_15775 [Sphingomonas hengshuiensis]